MRETLSPESETAPANRVEQAGAICYRMCAGRSPEVLLVASRRNGQWGIPKGHVETGESSGTAAAREALEEAGVRGIVSDVAIGSFVYTKDRGDLAYHIDVHLLEVEEMLADFPEKDSRQRQWAPLETAAREVSNPRLRELLLCLAGRTKPGQLALA